MDHTGWHCALLCSKMSSLVTARSTAPVELTSYTKHSLENAMGQPNGQALFQGWRLPCLGLTVIGKLNNSGSSEFDITYIIPGPCITFYTMVSDASSASPLHCL